MKKLFYLLLAIFTFSSTEIDAQGFNSNLTNYWWYRYRMVNDFMKIGPNCGESIPAAIRVEQKLHTTTTKYSNQSISAPLIDFGDATIDLGMYIAVLATEYKLLKNNSMNVDRTVMELYFALKAFDRLDLTAEEKCRNFSKTIDCNRIYPDASDYNGFFIRDDVPDGFVASNIDHFNRPEVCTSVTEEQGNVKNRIDGYIYDGNSGFTDWSTMNPGVPQYPTEESQDQVAVLYEGLGLTTILLPTNGVIYNGENLHVLADNAFVRMSNYILARFGVITNPISQVCVYGTSPSNWGTSLGCINSGGMVHAYLMGLQRGSYTANLSISNHANLALYETLYLPAVVPFLPTSPYNAMYQAVKYWPSWNCQNFNHSANIRMGLSFEVFAAKWRVALNSVNASRFFVNLKSSKCNIRFPHFPLMYRLMHGGPMIEVGPGKKHEAAFTISELLDKAPPCGPYRFNGTEYYDFEWSTYNRLVEPHKRGIHGDQSPNGEFVGLDYMLLFNLFCLNNGYFPFNTGSVPIFANPYYAEEWNHSLPWGATYASHNDPKEFKFLEYVSSRSHLKSNANAKFRCAKQIELKPGFKVDFGGTFEAYIKDYKCCGDGGLYKTDDGNDPFVLDSIVGTEPVMNEIPEDTMDNYEPSEDEIITDSIAIMNQLQEMSDTLPELAEFLSLYFGSENPDEDPMERQEPKGTRPNLPIGILSLYPNPTTGIFSILSNSDEHYDVYVYSRLGQLIHTRRNCVSNCDMDITGYANGQYTVKLVNQNETITKKVTLMK